MRPLSLFRLRVLLPGVDVDAIVDEAPELALSGHGMDCEVNLRALKQKKGLPRELLPQLIAARPQMLLSPYMFEASGLRHSSGAGLVPNMNTDGGHGSW